MFKANKEEFFYFVIYFINFFNWPINLLKLLKDRKIYFKKICCFALNSLKELGFYQFKIYINYFSVLININ